MYVKYKLITLVDKTIFKRIRVQTQRYSDINFNSQKKIKLEKERIPVINCFSDESTLSSKSDVNEDTNIIKASKSILEISLIQNESRKKNIIKTAFSSTMLLTIISLKFNSNSNHFKIIDISRYLNFLEHKKLNINNPFSINGLNLYKKVMLRKHYDVFQITIYQYERM